MNKMLTAALLLLPLAALADEPEYTLVIENHKFIPAEITIPANTKVKFIIENKDPGAEEFDSRALNREKVILGKNHGSVFIGPLAPGRYAFQGEYHAETAQGFVIAK